MNENLMLKIQLMEKEIIMILQRLNNLENEFQKIVKSENEKER